eukprot:scaffold11396_cov48-Skeletonema_dohrnii-CCMP3373.AAC.2
MEEGLNRIFVTSSYAVFALAYHRRRLKVFLSIMKAYLQFAVIALLNICLACGFTTPISHEGRRVVISDSSVRTRSASSLQMAKISEKEAQSAIDKVVAALRKDKIANEELGQLKQVNNILGFGSPQKGKIAVRFNASFQKGGKGLSSIPLPFGLGQSNKSEGRGTMVGQVKASVNEQTGKVIECSVFRDLGYGRAFNLKV